jgi:hypothetical protein
LSPENWCVGGQDGLALLSRSLPVSRQRHGEQSVHGPGGATDSTSGTYGEQAVLAHGFAPVGEPSETAPPPRAPTPRVTGTLEFSSVDPTAVTGTPRERLAAFEAPRKVVSRPPKTETNPPPPVSGRQGANSATPLPEKKAPASTPTLLKRPRKRRTTPPSPARRGPGSRRGGGAARGADGVERERADHRPMTSRRHA